MKTFITALLYVPLTLNLVCFLTTMTTMIRIITATSKIAFVITTPKYATMNTNESVTTTAAIVKMHMFDRLSWCRSSQWCILYNAREIFEVSLDFSLLFIASLFTSLKKWGKCQKTDLVLVNKKKRTCQQVNFAIQAYHKVNLKNSEKLNKCHDLAKELKESCCI